MPSLHLTDKQFEAMCLACMDYRFLGDRGRLTEDDTRNYDDWTKEDGRNLETSILKLLKDTADRVQLTEVADALAMHWQDIDSPHGEYKSASSPLVRG